jgi:hypothetical protein
MDEVCQRSQSNHIMDTILLRDRALLLLHFFRTSCPKSRTASILALNKLAELIYTCLSKSDQNLQCD